MDDASKHGCFILMLAELWLYRGGMHRVGGQDVRNGAISIRADSAMSRCCCTRGRGGGGVRAEDI